MDSTKDPDMEMTYYDIHLKELSLDGKAVVTSPCPLHFRPFSVKLDSGRMVARVYGLSVPSGGMGTVKVKAYTSSNTIEANELMGWGYLETLMIDKTVDLHLFATDPAPTES